MKKTPNITDDSSTLDKFGILVLDYKKRTMISCHTSQRYADADCLRLLEKDDSEKLMTVKVTKMFNVKKDMEIYPHLERSVDPDYQWEIVFGSEALRLK